jgi:hypothetical protein
MLATVPECTAIAAANWLKSVWTLVSYDSLSASPDVLFRYSTNKSDPLVAIRFC